jgi:hypothetical protein
MTSGCLCLSPLRSYEYLWHAYQYVVVPEELFMMNPGYLPRYPEITGFSVKVSVK